MHAGKRVRTVFGIAARVVRADVSDPTNTWEPCFAKIKTEQYVKSHEMLPFRQRLTEDQRRREFSRVSDKLHRFVPIIMERGSRDAPRIGKEKFLVPVDLTMAQLSFVVRKRLELRSSDALFLMVNKTLCTSTATAGSVYDAHRDTDGFLYVTYTMENTFG